MAGDVLFQRPRSWASTWASTGWKQSLTSSKTWSWYFVAEWTSYQEYLWIIINRHTHMGCSWVGGSQASVDPSLSWTDITWHNFIMTVFNMFHVCFTELHWPLPGMHPIPTGSKRSATFCSLRLIKIKDLRSDCITAVSFPNLSEFTKWLVILIAVGVSMHL